MLRRPVESAQYLAIRYTERLAEAGAVTSVGSRGDSYDNALAETIIGLYKTELIRRRGPWRGIDDVEYATLEWVDWFNHRRLLEPIGYVPPAEFEAAFHTTGGPQLPCSTQATEPPMNPGRFRKPVYFDEGSHPIATPSLQPQPWSNFRARRKTRSSIGSVRRPVCVFCWLTWKLPSSTRLGAVRLVTVAEAGLGADGTKMAQR